MRVKPRDKGKNKQLTSIEYLGVKNYYIFLGSCLYGESNPILTALYNVPRAPDKILSTYLKFKILKFQVCKKIGSSKKSI